MSNSYEISCLRVAIKELEKVTFDTNINAKRNELRALQQKLLLSQEVSASIPLTIDTINSIRKDLRAMLVRFAKRNTAQSCQASDRIHVALLALAKGWPLNNHIDGAVDKPLMCPITQSELTATNSIALSSGYHYNTSDLIYWLKQPIAKKREPATNEVLCLHDDNYINDRIKCTSRQLNWARAGSNFGRKIASRIFPGFLVFIAVSPLLLLICGFFVIPESLIVGSLLLLLLLSITFYNNNALSYLIIIAITESVSINIASALLLMLTSHTLLLVSAYILLNILRAPILQQNDLHSWVLFKAWLAVADFIGSSLGNLFGLIADMLKPNDCTKLDRYLTTVFADIEKEMPTSAKQATTISTKLTIPAQQAPSFVSTVSPNRNIAFFQPKQDNSVTANTTEPSPALSNTINKY